MRIRELRLQHKMTQSKLAKLMNVARSTVAMWETSDNQPSNERLLELADLFDVSVDYILQRETDSICSLRVPVLGTVAAGIPIDAIEEIVDWEDIPESMAKSGEFFGLRIKGHSMEPRIMEGDTVIVRQQPDVESGDIAIVLVNGDEGTCKKLVKHSNGGISLIAINSAVYSPHFYTNDEIESLPITIVGKVVELRGKF